MPLTPATANGSAATPTLSASRPISPLRGTAWRHTRRHLLQGNDAGSCTLEMLPEGTLRYLKQLPRESVLCILNAAANGLQLTTLKDDHKRTIYRVWLDGQSFILKTYRNLHRWLAVSPDTKGWLCSHRLQNDVPCYAWYRRHDLSSATIIYADAGNRDLYMPECLQESQAICSNRFAQAGAIIAALHRQNIFHADTKPSNFVFQDGTQQPSTVQLIDTDDVRAYWHLSRKRRAKNLAQFLGCTRRDILPTIYDNAHMAFLHAYMNQLPAQPMDILALIPEIRRAMAILYPDRIERQQQLCTQLLARLQQRTEA